MSCQHATCNSKATHGYLHDKVTCCIMHIDNKMIHPIRPVCIIKNCLKLAYYSNVDFPKRCNLHKKEKDTDSVHSQCAYLGCKFNKYKRYHSDKAFKKVSDVDSCFACDKLSGTVEYQILKALRAKYPSIVHTSSAKTGRISNTLADQVSNFKFNPSFVLLANNTQVCNYVIQLDSYQRTAIDAEHKLEYSDYRGCLKRMIDIHETDFKQSPTIFIRVNTTSYFDKGANIIDFDKQRTEMLISVLDSLHTKNIDAVGNDKLSCVYLYYDSYDGENQVRSIEYTHQNHILKVYHEHPRKKNVAVHEL